MTKRIMPWPEDGGPLALEDLARPVLHAIRFAYDLNRRDRRRNIPWRGPEIVDTGTLACCPPITERLKAHRLAYAEEDQGRDTLEEIVCAALQLGIEQGRRIAKSSVQELLSETYGATFTLSVGYDHTHLHTQSGIMADPVECLRRAIGALTDEMARVQRCPRQRALGCVPNSEAAPAPAGTRPKGGDAEGGSMRSTSDAVPKAGARTVSQRLQGLCRPGLRRGK